MESEALALLCDPDTRYSFELDGQTLRNTATGRVYPIRDGIPLFISSLTGANLRLQSRYDRMARFYDLGERLNRWMGKSPDFRAELAAALELAPGARVLEVAVGTGANIPYLPQTIDLYGIDISWPMLIRCRRKLRKSGRSVRLFHGEAARLPFCSSAFDCVFAACVLGALPEPARAVTEMVWVTRPGGRIVIADRFSPAGNNGQDAAPVFPMDLVPEGMENVQARTIGEGQLYCLSFSKPLD
ncbi:MAG TPA: methyltransferase domain-containing protein [Terracidiphilus sp.]|nr:methyltransferase domain-containing protein [Terracidiphilus sp.]